MDKSTAVISLPEELQPFVLLVLDDPDLQTRLGLIREAKAFVTESVAIARQRALALNAEVLWNALRPDPLGFGRFGLAPIETHHWPPQGWHPTRAVPTGHAPAIDWLWFGNRRLTLPFFEDEVRQAAAMPLNWLFRIRTAMPALIGGAALEPTLPLAGLVYHMSRCGSTLVAQLLSAVPDHAVSSEPEPLDGVIQWARLGGADNAEAVAAIRGVVAALGRNRSTGATRHFIKLDAWHAFSLPLLRRAFPDVPWLYLYRDATEVMVSTMLMPGVHTAPGMLPEAVLGFAPDPRTMREDFAAQVLARIGQSIVENWRLGGGLVLAYPDIAELSHTSLAAHFGFTLNADQRAMMAAATRRDAKAPTQTFANDVAAKHAAATPEVTAAVSRWMLAVERDLDQLAASGVAGRSPDPN